jgi:hypothetical protein
MIIASWTADVGAINDKLLHQICRSHPVRAPLNMASSRLQGFGVVHRTGHQIHRPQRIRSALSRRGVSTSGPTGERVLPQGTASQDRFHLRSSHFRRDICPFMVMVRLLKCEQARAIIRVVVLNPR